MTCVAWIVAVLAVLAGPVYVFGWPGLALGVPCAASLAVVGLSRETVRRDARYRARRSLDVERELQKLLVRHGREGR
ncbi:hypothetical protein SK069_05685 [Patulibacter brassicae]|uniref:DUF4229 domain-containing protein n=1 Tax=Patulibacter brassicae TaxID=1705717 RepID=A0ABU4VGY6_9ACTN|nr:hypothetical protein [Patulibacter brassicae]MDX8151075.1 hypothetical protein [Patulibacter brassicae]